MIQVIDISEAVEVMTSGVRKAVREKLEQVVIGRRLTDDEWTRVDRSILDAPRSILTDPRSLKEMVITIVGVRYVP